MKRMKFIKWIVILLVMLLASDTLLGQVKRPGENNLTVRKLEPLQGRVEGKDTILIKDLKPVVIFAWKTPPNRRTRRLIRNIKKVYPYARLASIKLWEYDGLLKKAETARERKKLMKQAEKELESEFGDELKKLNITQGRILLKLIDRETGETSFDLVQDLRGKFAAFFWQSLARIFGYNLKADYDPDGRDKKIEEIVQLIEEGKI